MNQAKVLIIEDDPVFAKNLVQSLVTLGYQVMDWVTSGQAALDCISQSPPDVVLVNIHLINGIGTVAQIQTQYNIPTICLSQSGNPEILQQIKRVSPGGYLIKPFNEEDIQAVIEISLNKYQPSNPCRMNGSRTPTQEQNDYVSMISHEFRTPLTSIRIATKILQEYEDDLSRDRKEDYFRQIYGAIQNLDGIIEDFLVMSQAESGKLPIEPGLLDLQDFCQKLMTIHQSTHHSKHNFILDIHETCQQVALDERRLRYILNNLLSNAIKYSPEGGEVRLEVNCQGDEVSFRVSDQGIGIPLDYQTKLFQRFERAENVGRIRGIGLGLSIVKQIVEEQGGAIAVESELGVGTTVTVTLPGFPTQ
jgi:signal transduction histidine kinase